MEAGPLDRRLTILRSTTATNDFGEEVVSWEPLTTVWASKQDIRDAERYAAQEVAAIITTRFRIRYSSLVAGMSPDDRVTCEGIEYGVTAVKEIGRREGLEITAATRAER
jgi:SPP1 family predicted phage head-tail adaptor